MARSAASTTTYDLWLALPLAGFFVAFFVAPLLILIFTPLVTTTSFLFIMFIQQW